MRIINISNAKKNLNQLISDVNKGFNPITIINSKGNNAVLISKDNWIEANTIIHSNAILDNRNSIKKAKKTK